MPTTMTQTPLTDGDLDVMRALHAALRRDSDRLERAAERFGAQDHKAHDALLLGWECFSSSLHHHHRIEDTHIWPLLRQKRTDSPDDVAVLNAMEQEHAGIDPAIEAVQRTLGDRQASREDVASSIADFVGFLRAHLEHEERDAFPLIRRHITHQEWDALNKASMKDLSLGELSRMGPWLLDGVKPEDASRVLQEIPPPLRLLHRFWWNPRYQRARRWE